MMLLFRFAWLILGVVTSIITYVIFKIVKNNNRVPEETKQLKPGKEKKQMYSYDDLKTSLDYIQKQRQQAEIDYENMQQNIQYDILLQQYQKEQDAIIKEYYRKKAEIDREYYNKDKYHSKSTSVANLAVGSVDDTISTMIHYFKSRKQYEELLKQSENKLIELKQKYELQTMDIYKLRENYADIKNKIENLEHKKEALHGFGSGRKKVLIDKDLDILYKESQNIYKEIQNRGFDTVADMDRYFESSKSWQDEIKKEWDKIEQSKGLIQDDMNREVELSIPIIKRYEMQYSQCISELLNQEKILSGQLKSQETLEDRIQSLDREIRDTKEKLNDPKLDILERIDLEKKLYGLEKEKGELEARRNHQLRPDYESIRSKLNDANTKMQDIQNFKNNLKPYMTQEQKNKMDIDQKQEQAFGLSM